MDIKKLKTIIKDNIKDGTLTLSDTVLESNSIKQLFDSYLENDHLVMNNVPPPNETVDSITVQGTGGNLPFKGMDPLTAEFTVVNEEAVLSLTATGQEGWSFQSSFPMLKDSFISELEFDPAPTMRFASYSNPPQSQSGLQFGGVLKVSPPLSELAWLIGGKSEVELTGPIQIQMDVPQMALSAELAGPVNVGFFELPSMEFEVRCDPVESDKDKPPSFQAAMRFASDIRFRANGTDVDIGIGADFMNTPGPIQFYIEPNKAVKAGLEELRSLMHGADLNKIIPSDFHLEDIIELNNIVVQVDPAARKLASVIIGIK